MNTSSLIKRALVSALGVYAYIALLTLIASNSLFEIKAPWWLGASLFLILFVVSVCVTGTMVLLKPILLYVEGQKKQALHLFGYTVIALATIALIVGIILVRLALKT